MAAVERSPLFAVVCSFLERYGETLRVATFSFAELETALGSRDSVPQELVTLHLRLLKTMGQSIAVDRWEKHLAKICEDFDGTLAWELKTMGYNKLSIRNKLLLLKFLCESQFDENVRFKNTVNEEEASTMRLQPVGRDRAGLLYWLQLDCDLNLRLYTEEPDDDGESTWKLLSRSREEVEEVIEKLKIQAKNPDDAEGSPSGSGSDAEPEDEADPSTQGKVVVGGDQQECISENQQKKTKKKKKTTKNEEEVAESGEGNRAEAAEKVDGDEDRDEDMEEEDEDDTSVVREAVVKLERLDNNALDKLSRNRNGGKDDKQAKLPMKKREIRMAKEDDKAVGGAVRKATSGDVDADGAEVRADSQSSKQSDLHNGGSRNEDGEESVHRNNRQRSPRSKKEVADDEEDETKEKDGTKGSDSEHSSEGSHDDSCKRCGLSTQPELILLCDDCDSGYHTACLRPPLMIVPEGEWYCPPCQHRRLWQQLEEEMQNLDVLVRRRDRDLRRKERLSYVGISRENILPRKHSAKAGRNVVKTEEDGESEDDDRGEKVHRKKGWRKRTERRSSRARKSISYQYKEFDEAINEAIEDDMREALEVSAEEFEGEEGDEEEEHGNGLAGAPTHRGKDISTILEASQNAQSETKGKESAGDEDKQVEEEAIKSDKEDVEEGQEGTKKRRRAPARHRRRRLTALDSFDEDSGDEEYKESNSDQDGQDFSAEEYKSGVASSDEEGRSFRGRAQRRKRSRTVPTRQSLRLRKRQSEAQHSSSEDPGDMSSSSSSHDGNKGARSARGRHGIRGTRARAAKRQERETASETTSENEEKATQELRSERKRKAAAGVNRKSRRGCELKRQKRSDDKKEEEEEEEDDDEEKEEEEEEKEEGVEKKEEKGEEEEEEKEEEKEKEDAKDEEDEKDEEKEEEKQEEDGNNDELDKGVEEKKNVVERVGKGRRPGNKMRQMAKESQPTEAENMGQEGQERARHGLASRGQRRGQRKSRGRGTVSTSNTRSRGRAAGGSGGDDDEDPDDLLGVEDLVDYVTAE